MGSTKVQVITFRARLATVGQYADDVEKKDRAARATTTFTTSIVGRAKGCYDLKWCRTEFTRFFFLCAYILTNNSHDIGILIEHSKIVILFALYKLL